MSDVKYVNVAFAVIDETGSCDETVSDISFLVLLEAKRGQWANVTGRVWGL